MEYNILKDSIKAVIKENGNGEITGQLLQDTLLAVVNSLGTGYQFMGLYTGDVDDLFFTQPDQKVAYLFYTDKSTAGDTFDLPSAGLYLFTFDTGWALFLLMRSYTIPKVVEGEEVGSNTSAWYLGEDSSSLREIEQASSISFTDSQGNILTLPRCDMLVTDNFSYIVDSEMRNLGEYFSNILLKGVFGTPDYEPDSGGGFVFGSISCVLILTGGDENLTQKNFGLYIQI